MSLASRYAEPVQQAGQQKFTCPHYSPLPDSRRCRNYLDNGACSRPDELMCSEWLKANGQAVQEKAAPAERSEPGQKKPTDLFGNPLPPPPAEKPGKKETRPVIHPARPTMFDSEKQEEEQGPPLRGLTTEDIESFKALRVEVCIESESIGQVWLVPEYTGQDRKEITPEHLATLCRVHEAFPGSRVLSFEKLSKNQEETKP